MRGRASLLALLAVVAFSSSGRAQNVALVAEHLYTMDTGPQGGPGMVLIHQGKIEDVRQGANVQAPQGYHVMRGAVRHPRAD